jgi:hypothetical protein
MTCTMCGKNIEGQDETQDYAIIVCPHCGGVFLKTPELNLSPKPEEVPPEVRLADDGSSDRDRQTEPPSLSSDVPGEIPIVVDLFDAQPPKDREVAPSPSVEAAPLPPGTSSFGWRVGPTQSESAPQENAESAFDSPELRRNAFTEQAEQPMIPAVALSSSIASPPSRELPPPLKNVELSRPGVSQIHQKRGRLRMAWPWQRGFMRLLFILWAGIWYIGTLVAVLHYYDTEKMGCMFGVLPALLVLGYFPLVNAVNNEVIEVSRHFIMRSCQPLPWFGNLKIPSSDVKQIYCREDRKRIENDSPTYTVNAILKSGREVVLVAWIEKPDHALLVETQAEDQLGIVDVPVPGELRK